MHVIRVGVVGFCATGQRRIRLLGWFSTVIIFLSSKRKRKEKKGFWGPLLTRNGFQYEVLEPLVPLACACSHFFSSSNRSLGRANITLRLTLPNSPPGMAFYWKNLGSFMKNSWVPVYPFKGEYAEDIHLDFASNVPSRRRSDI